MKSVSAVAAGIVVLGLVGAPAGAQAAKVKFGAKLDSQVQPSNSLPSHDCDDLDPAAMCTFVMNEAYGRPNGGEKAPKKGKLKKVKIVAGGPGSYRLQLVKAKKVAGQWQVKLKKNGPMLHVKGQGPDNWADDNYDVEKFKVGNLKIKKGWRLALQGTSTSAVRCSSGGDNTLIVNPQLHKGWGWQAATGDDGCFPLVEGIIKYNK